jgi:predicted HicB family RNase H-like nuclease
MIPNTMQYREYTATIQYDDDDGLFYGDVMDLRDTITFSGSSAEELKHAFRQAVDDYIEFCAGRGEVPDKPFSGRFVLRLDPSLHRRASIAAGALQVSLNSFIARAVEREVSAVASSSGVGRSSLASPHVVPASYPT